MTTVTTASGSVYEFTNGLVRRVNSNAEKRADHAWIALVTSPIIELGSPMVLYLRSLSEYGDDDLGRSVGGGVTTRITTAVTSIEK